MKINRKNLLCLAKDLQNPLRELVSIRGDFTVLNDNIDAFSDYETALKSMKKTKSSLLVSSSKSTLVFMRTHENQPLEILKFKVKKALSSSDFPSLPPELFMKQFVVCQGVENKRIENFFVDFLSQNTRQVNLESVKYAWIIHSDESKLLTIKFTRIHKNGLEDIGPYFELELEKEFYCGDDLYLKAFTTIKAKKQKNVSKNVFKDKVGKLHIDRQDLREVNLKKSRGYKKLKTE